MKTANWYQPTR